MKKFSPILDTSNFEIRYASGYLYFDRCGQCLLDIERECEGWLAVSVSPQTGKLERPDKDFRLSFNNDQFNFSVHRASKVDIDLIAKEASVLWKIVQANLGIDVFLRVGYRLSYLLATQSTEDAEKLLRQSELNVEVPNKTINSGYTIKSQQIVTVLCREEMEYRVQLGTVTRHEAINPANILRGDPRILSKKQNEFRMAQFKQLSEYSANPMYAVCLDVDCAQIKPDAVSVQEFIVNQSEIVANDFLPILEKL